jgi:signal transduction histidine kinase
MLKKTLTFFSGLSRLKSYIVCILIVTGLGVSDYLTGYELSFSIFYLIPVSLASWYLGLYFGRQIAVFSALAWLIVDLSSGHVYSRTIIPFWNATVRMGFFLITAQLLAALYKHVQREEKTNEQLARLVDERTYDLRIANENLKQEIVDRKLAEAEAIRSNQLAALGEMAANIAHEINNPVNGVINYAQILADQSKPGSQEMDICNRIIRESDRIAGIVSSLLSFAREGDKVKRPVRIYEIIVDSLALTEAHLKKDNIKLSVRVPSDLPEILANAQQILQVFLNILSNARYALNQRYPSAAEDKTLEIAAQEVTLDDKPYIRITFHDHGIGIPDNIIDKVINPFFTTKPENIGTGLGLSISYGIIKDHGGNLLLESGEKEFTRIIIDLPVT